MNDMNVMNVKYAALLQWMDACYNRESNFPVNYVHIIVRIGMDVVQLSLDRVNSSASIKPSTGMQEQIASMDASNSDIAWLQRV